MAKIYDKNYAYADLTIPASIWNDKTVFGVAKIILTLFKRFTSNGTQTCEALTGQMSRMIHTHEKDIKYNMQKLHEAGHIEVYKDDLSRTGWSVRYLYQEKAKAEPSSPNSSQLF